MKTGLLVLVSVTLLLIKTSKAADHKHKHSSNHHHNEVMWYEENEAEKRPQMFKADHKYCSAYYMCLNGDCRIHYCPKNHIWLDGNGKLGKCVNNEKNEHHCHVNEEESLKTREFNCPKIADNKMFVNGHFGDDKDCNAFYLCQNGLRYAYLCPKGLVWNDFYGSCTEKEQSPCYNEIGSGDLGSGFADEFHSTHHNSDHGTNQNDEYTKKKENIKKTWGHVQRKRSRRNPRSISLSLDFNEDGIIHEEMLIPTNNERKSKK